MSVSLALSLSREERVFLLSTDPAGSLGDIFGKDLMGKIAPLSDNLQAMELTRDFVIKRWREKFGDEIYTVISSLIPVGREILDYLEGAPGIDEEFILDFLLDSLKSDNYDFIVWDTAPTSSTLSLLRIQLLFYSHLTEAQKLYLKLKGFFKKDSPLELIKKWRRLTEEIIKMLREETLCWIVATPERLPVVQALRLKEDMESFGIEVKGFILNRCIPPREIGESGFLKGKSQVQARWKEYLLKKASLPVVEVEEGIGELGEEDYRRIGGLLKGAL